MSEIYKRYLMRSGVPTPSFIAYTTRDDRGGSSAGDDRGGSGGSSCGAGRCGGGTGKRINQ